MTMTIAELKASNKVFLTPTDVAGILNCHPYAISLAARDHPEKLGFPVNRIGSRTRIPRKAFLRFCGEEVP